MTQDFENARTAVRDLALFFLEDNWVEPNRVDIGKLRHLTDSITIVNHYLCIRRQQEKNRLLNGFGDQCQIRHGHVGDHVSRNGAGKDYELPASETDGRLVEVDSHGATSRCGESGGMQLG